MAYIREVPPDRAWIAKYAELGVRRMLGNRVQEKRQASAPIADDPTPEAGAFVRSPERPPGAADKREVEQKNGVSSVQPCFNSIRGAKVTIQDPSFFPNKPLLQLNPLIARRWEKAGTPEKLVQLDHGQARDFSQAQSQSRFPGASTA
jgi:hypothetical protein